MRRACNRAGCSAAPGIIPRGVGCPKAGRDPGFESQGCIRRRSDRGSGRAGSTFPMARGRGVMEGFCAPEPFHDVTPALCRHRKAVGSTRGWGSTPLRPAVRVRGGRSMGAERVPPDVFTSLGSVWALQRPQVQRRKTVRGTAEGAHFFERNVSGRVQPHRRRLRGFQRVVTDASTMA
jgi:hypothetical protein